MFDMLLVLFMLWPCFGSSCTASSQASRISGRDMAPAPGAVAAVAASARRRQLAPIAWHSEQHDVTTAHYTNKIEQINE